MSDANSCIVVIQEPRPVPIASTTAKMSDQLRNWCLLHKSMTEFVVSIFVLFFQCSVDRIENRSFYKSQCM